jgi:hypothetical protein
MAGLPRTGGMTMVDHLLEQVARELPTFLASVISYAHFDYHSFIWMCIADRNGSFFVISNLNGAN